MLGSYREKCEMLYRSALFSFRCKLFLCCIWDGFFYIIIRCCFLVIKPYDSITFAFAPS